jgi:hypothetical protein
MITTIDVTGNGITVNVVTDADTPAIPAPGDEVSIPTPHAQPAPGAYQQLTIQNSVYRFEPAAVPPTLYVLLITNDPIA